MANLETWKGDAAAIQVDDREIALQSAVGRREQHDDRIEWTLRGQLPSGHGLEEGAMVQVRAQAGRVGRGRLALGDAHYRGEGMAGQDAVIHGDGYPPFGEDRSAEEWVRTLAPAPDTRALFGGPGGPEVPDPPLTSRGPATLRAGAVDELRVTITLARQDIEALIQRWERREEDSGDLGPDERHDLRQLRDVILPTIEEAEATAATIVGAATEFDAARAGGRLEGLASTIQRIRDALTTKKALEATIALAHLGAAGMNIWATGGG